MVVFLLRVPSMFAEEAKSGWKGDWEKTLAAAKKEGTLSFVSGSSSRDYIGFFRKAYPDIQVEFLEMRAPDLQVRIPTERRAGVFAWDIILMGGSAGVTDFVPAGIFGNLREALIYQISLKTKPGSATSMTYGWMTIGKSLKYTTRQD